MSERTEGLVYMNPNSLQPVRPPGLLNSWWLFPVAVLLLAVTALTLAFVPQCATAGGSLIGSDIGWVAVTSAASLVFYGFLRAIKCAQLSSNPCVETQSTPARLSRATAELAIVSITLAMLVVVAVAQSALWALTASRAMLVAQMGALILYGAHELYVSFKLASVHQLLASYDTVLMNPSESVALNSTIWDECEAVRKAIGIEALQAERIHFLENQKAALAAELVRISENSQSPESSPEITCIREQQVIEQCDSQGAELRSLRAKKESLSDEIDELIQVNDEQSKMVCSFQNELREEQILNHKLSSTMEQMKAVLETTIKARDEARHKYKVLKKSVTKIVTQTSISQPTAALIGHASSVKHEPGSDIWVPHVDGSISITSLS